MEIRKGTLKDLEAIAAVEAAASPAAASPAAAAEDAAASEEAEEDAAEPQNRLFIQSGRSPPRMALPGLAEQPVSASSAAVSPE